MALSAALREFHLLRVSAAKKQLFYKSQRIFEHGEKTGRMLAWLSRGQMVSTPVANIRDDTGRLLTDPDEINSRFASYYVDLYSSKAEYVMSELQSYLDTVDFPVLTAEARSSLDAPFTLKEI